MRKSGEGLLRIATPGRKLLGVVVFLGGRTVFNEDERKLGAMLKEQEKAGRYRKLHAETSEPTTLADQGITKIESHRWQQVARHQSPPP